MPNFCGGLLFEFLNGQQKMLKYRVNLKKTKTTKRQKHFKA